MNSTSSRPEAGPTTDPVVPSETDVLVVGGGIAGTSVLYHLARNGIEATLVDRGRLAGGATEAAVGVLSPPLRQPFQETERDQGPTRARAIWSFALESVRALGEALQEMGAADEAELDLSGGHVLAESHSRNAVRGSFEALAGAGFPVSWLEAAEVQELCGARGFHGAYRLEGGGALNPAATARALARWASDRGCRVVEGVEVGEVIRNGDGLACRTDRGEILARMVVYATHIDSRRFSSLVGEELVPIRGQGFRAAVQGMPRQRGSFATHWKMNVWRQGPDDTLYVSGWRHNAWGRAYRQAEAELDPRLQSDLEECLRSVFPGAEIQVSRRWSGVFGWTSDYLPLVGPLPGTPDELVVTGFSGGGLPFAFHAGRILADGIAGKPPLEGGRLFSPRRFV